MIVVAGVTNKTDLTKIQEFTLTRKIEYPGYFKFFLLEFIRKKILPLNINFCSFKSTLLFRVIYFCF